MPRANRISCTSLFFYILVTNLLTLTIQAQSADNDTLTPHRAWNNAVQQYHDYLTPESGLYRGSEYVQYAYQLKEGHPYFDQDHMRKGSVLYRGIRYNDLPLIYDLVKQLLVINDPFNTFKIALINEEIDSFTIANHIFIRLKDSLDPSAPRVGFYEQLYKGRTWILKKEKKEIREEINLTVDRFIDQSVSYYLKKGNTYFPVNNKRALLHALNDKSQETKKFMRRNSLRMTADKENTLIKVAAWYDSLNQ
jgi:hypothetical protein